MTNKPDRQNYGGDKTPTMADSIRLRAEADDLILEADKFMADLERTQASSNNFDQMMDELCQHYDVVDPDKSGDKLFELISEAENEIAGCVGDNSLPKDSMVIEYLYKNVHKLDLDERSVEIIKNYAIKGREFADKSNSFRLPKEFRIQMRVMFAQAIQGVATIALYLALFFVLFKIFF